MKLTDNHQNLQKKMLLGTYGVHQVVLVNETKSRNGTDQNTSNSRTCVSNEPVMDLEWTWNGA